MLFETLSVLGTIAATALTLNYWMLVAGAVQSWVPFHPTVISFLAFWGMFAALYVAVHLVLKRIGQVVKWERLHWSIQGIGMVVGGVKGLWVSGLLLMALTASGFDYLRKSAEQESLFGPPLLRLAQPLMTEVADRLPGARQRGSVLVPPAKPPK